MSEQPDEKPASSGQDSAQSRLATALGEIEPNAEQRALITTLEGPVLVDAGAGTGKTFTIAHRYLEVLGQRDVSPQEILLITFTNNAAEEMRERILRVGRPTITPSQLRDAPISTFHALAKRILERHGFEVPAHLGLDAHLAPNVSIVENEVLERELFGDFLRGFRKQHPEHRDRFRALRDAGNLLDLVKGLAAKGIVPTREGWYRGGERELRGDREAFMRAFGQMNETDGNSQSKLRERLSRYKDKLVLPEAPTREEVRGSYGTKKVDEAIGERAFEAPREGLLAFVHDVYLAYLAYALERNVLNFPFLLVLAFVLLVEDEDLRERLSSPFVMIDEFQDTSEIQLKLALLFCTEEANLCCVGDWKQSIYSFQYASVDNILSFEDRVQRYARRLNEDLPEDERRAPPAEVFGDQLQRIDLVENYRSTQAILDRARRALHAPGKKNEDPTTDERAHVVELSSNARLEDTRLQAYHAEDEIGLVLDRIQAIVGSEAYRLVDEEATSEGSLATRTPSWEDIAVLTRTRGFALDLQDRARELGVPMAFEGGVEVYSSDAAKLLLAWLRILEDPRSRRGWVLVLEEAGYRLDEVDAMLEEGRFPDTMQAFARRLAKLGTVASQARAVFDRYGLRDGVTEALIANLQQTFESTGRTPAEIVRLLEDNLDAATTEPIDDHPGGDVVTAQTIHAAKGLEYPIVILADVNGGRFPSRGGGPPSVIGYTEPVGLRQSKVYAEPEDAPAYVYDDWRALVLGCCLPGTDRDEERRLFYVAMSRAEQHLLFTATTGRQSPFFEHVAPEAEELVPKPVPAQVDTIDDRQPLQVSPPANRAPRAVPVADLVEEPTQMGGRGRRFGQRLHAFAARYAMGQASKPANEDEENVAAIVDELAEGASLKPEVPCRVPLRWDGIKHVVEGKIDLLAVGPDRVDVVDWKTAAPGEDRRAYANQVGTYAHIVDQIHPDKDLHAWIVYTPTGKRVEVPPLSEQEIVEMIEQARYGSKERDLGL